MTALLAEATTSGIVGRSEGASPQINGLRLPWRASILRARSRSLEFLLILQNPSQSGKSFIPCGVLGERALSDEVADRFVEIPTTALCDLTAT